MLLLKNTLELIVSLCIGLIFVGACLWLIAPYIHVAFDLNLNIFANDPLKTAIVYGGWALGSAMFGTLVFSARKPRRARAAVIASYVYAGIGTLAYALASIAN